MRTWLEFLLLDCHGHCILMPGLLLYAVVFLDPSAEMDQGIIRSTVGSPFVKSVVNRGRYGYGRGNKGNVARMGWDWADSAECSPAYCLLPGYGISDLTRNPGQHLRQIGCSGGFGVLVLGMNLNTIPRVTGSYDLQDCGRTCSGNDICLVDAKTDFPLSLPKEKKNTISVTTGI